MKKKLLIGCISALVVIAIATVSIIFVVNGGKKYTISYEANGGYTETLEKEVRQGKEFQLEIPTNENATFLGWYSNLEENGEAITDVSGKSLSTYKLSQDSSVFAKWEYWDTEELDFDLLADGSGYGVSASKNFDGEVLKIPSDYNGKPVVRINSFGFNSKRNLKRVIMPDTITSIGISAFDDCVAIEFIDASKNLKQIDSRAFYSCLQLLSFDFPSTLEFIGEEAFSSCSMLGKVDLSAVTGELIIEERCFAGCVAVSDIVIAEKLEKISEYAFSGCTSLKAVKLDGAVKKVGNGAFQNCSHLRSIVLGKNVSMIGFYSFDKCEMLSEITVDSENEYYVSEDNVLFNKDKTMLLRYAPFKQGTAYSVPSSVREIDYGAFDSSYYLENINVGRNVQIINANAFSSMLEIKSLTVPFIGESRDFNTYFAFWFGGEFASTNTNVPYTLRSVVILDGIETIAEHSFQFCNSLTSIVMPDTVKTIQDYAFYGCSSLKTLRLPALLESIGEYVFLACTRLQSISIDESNSEYKTSDGVLYNSKMTELILYPAGKTETTFTANEKLESILDNAFYYSSSLKTVVLNEGIKDIGIGAFAYCRNLSEITISSTLETIGELAFNNCAKLESIELPASLTFIGKQAFYGCAKLEEVTLNITQPIQIEELAFLDTSENLKIIFESQEVLDIFAENELWAQYSSYFEVKQTEN